MTGLPLSLSCLACPDPVNRCRLLAIGSERRLPTLLRRRGWQVDTHALDLGPGAALAGEPFTPPVTAWPLADGDYDAVLLLDELAFVVDDVAAMAEAARVLRPGGRLLLRVPAAGPLAWLDPYNLYRYLRDATRRGLEQPETRGVGWRRHYRRRDLLELMGNRFRLRAASGQGIGLTDATRLALLVLFRWLLRWEQGYRLTRPLVAAVERGDRRLSLGAFGYDLVVVAERLPDDPG